LKDQKKVGFLLCVKDFIFTRRLTREKAEKNLKLTSCFGIVDLTHSADFLNPFDLVYWLDLELPYLQACFWPVYFIRMYHLLLLTKFYDLKSYFAAKKHPWKHRNTSVKFQVNLEEYIIWFLVRQTDSAKLIFSFRGLNLEIFLLVNFNNNIKKAIRSTFKWFLVNLEKYIFDFRFAKLIERKFSPNWPYSDPSLPIKKFDRWTFIVILKKL